MKTLRKLILMPGRPQVKIHLESIEISMEKIEKLTKFWHFYYTDPQNSQPVVLS